MSTHTLPHALPDGYVSMTDLILYGIGIPWAGWNVFAVGIDWITLLPPILFGVVALVRAVDAFVKIYRNHPSHKNSGKKPR